MVLSQHYLKSNGIVSKQPYTLLLLLKNQVFTLIYFEDNWYHKLDAQINSVFRK